MKQLDEGFRQLCETLRSATQAMNDLASKMHAARRNEYAAHGWPFGATDEAVSIWWEYDQHTTQN